MEEVFTIRILEDRARKLLGGGRAGDTGALVRKLSLHREDPVFNKLNAAEQRAIGSRDPLVLSWNVHRYYTKAELNEAKLFQVIISNRFEPAAEECGTQYDEAQNDSTSIIGVKRITPLCVDLSSLSASTLVTRNIGGELIVRQELAALLNVASPSTILTPVVHRGAKPRHLWFGLGFRGPLLNIAEITESGNTPFDKDVQGQYRHDNEGILGLNILSELYVKPEPGFTSCTMSLTSQKVGRNSGYLRPERLVVVGREVRDAILQSGFKGIRFEVTHVV